MNTEDRAALRRQRAKPGMIQWYEPLCI